MVLVSNVTPFRYSLLGFRSPQKSSDVCPARLQLIPGFLELIQNKSLNRFPSWAFHLFSFLLLTPPNLRFKSQKGASKEIPERKTICPEMITGPTRGRVGPSLPLSSVLGGCACPYRISTLLPFLCSSSSYSRIISSSL